jgi:hypothetical protein
VTKPISPSKANDFQQSKLMIPYINWLLMIGRRTFYLPKDEYLKYLNKQDIINIMDKYRAEGWTVSYYAGDLEFKERSE